uniref:Vacuolar protein sorting-associated protein 16 homolog n=1 Tax=Pristionchus pacificus TaxID=54126 RepID=A0A8R1UWT8_PRIPA
MANRNDDWVPIGDSKLKLERIYDDVNLNMKEVIHFSACPYSGPIAVCTSNGDSSFKITIHNSAGKQYSQVQVGDVIVMEWSRGHRLVVVSSRGSITLYTPLGEIVNQYALVRDVHVLSSLLFGASRHSGLAILDDSNRITVVNNVTDPVVWTIHPKDRPTTWTLMQAHSEVTNVVAVVKTTFYRSSQGESLEITDTPWAATEGEYIECSSDWANERIALLHSTHSTRSIHVTLPDLSSLLSTISIAPTLPIHSIGFISDSILFVHRKPSSVQFVSTMDASVYDHSTSFVHLGIECDGVRMYTGDSLIFVSHITQAEDSVVGVAPSAEGSLLVDAQRIMEEGSSTRTPYECIMTIKNMTKAIEECTNAAEKTRSPIQQKSIMKGARMGMAFNSSFDSFPFISLLRLMRIVNECALRRTAIPITLAQLCELSFSSLLSRLVDIDQFGLAIKLSQWMSKDGMETDRVVLAWLKKLIVKSRRKNESAETIDEMIASKLKEFPHVAFADAAEKAMEVGATDLAKKLIGREKNDERQVECLLKLGQVGEALARANTVQQPKLIHMVLRHLSRTLTKSQLELEIRKIPHVLCVYQEYVKQQSSGKQTLSLLTQSGDYERILISHMENAVATGDGPFASEEREQSLMDGKEAASLIRDSSLADLLQEAANRNTTTRMAVMDAVADPEAVARIAKQCKLNERQIHEWTVEGLARAHRWSHLMEFAKKKSPIGYAPFVRSCIRYGRKDEADKYLLKATLYEDQIEANLLLGKFVNAGKMAFDRRDEEMLRRIQGRALIENGEMSRKVGKMIESL